MKAKRQAELGPQVEVVCLACGRVKSYSPAVAARKKYCDAVCFARRKGSTRAMVIVHLLGGTTQIAKRLKVSPTTVNSWLQQGVPQRYHLDMLRLARERGVTAEVTLDSLVATQADGRAVRAAVLKHDDQQ